MFSLEFVQCGRGCWRGKKHQNESTEKRAQDHTEDAANQRGNVMMGVQEILLQDTPPQSIVKTVERLVAARELR